MRRRLLLTTALMPVALVLAPRPSYGLTAHVDAAGRVVAWFNPEVMAKLRASLAPGGT